VEQDPGKKVKLGIIDIDGILRGKVIHIDKFKSILNSDFGFCDVVFGWDMNDQLYDQGKFTGWHSGFPDAKAKIDISTYRRIPWDDNTPFFLADFIKKDGSPLDVCPRSLLKKINSQAKNAGFTAFFSQEFEWFNFKETSDELHQKDFNNPTPITSGMFGYSVVRASQNRGFFNDLFDQLKEFNIPIEGLHTETGPGVYEAAILYSEILEAADRASLFKTSVKEIGQMHGIMPSFIARWSTEYPGCSGHVHQSLWKDGKNVFFDPSDPDKMSSTMRSYLAGILQCLPEILPMVAPTINSYKRLVEGAWAPTNATWGIDNRTVALRALPSNDKSTRIECRVPGSDVNPYLAMSACLAAGLYGIKNKLKLTTPAITGNGYEDQSCQKFAPNLFEATKIMKNSKIAKELFGAEFVEHFCMTRDWEWREFSKNVTDWELKRYFEII
jgi:glutamine synthetase